MRRSSRSTPRLLACGLALAGVLVVVAALTPTRHPDRAAPQSSPTPDRTDAVAVLRDWDAGRAQAWRRGDVPGLRRLYVRGSSAGRADAALLRGYSGRGLRVTGMRMQVASVEVEAATEDRIELQVTDRLAGATVAGRGRTFPLPQDRWSRRRLVLVRVAGTWRVAAVRP